MQEDTTDEERKQQKEKERTYGHYDLVIVIQYIMIREQISDTQH